MNPLIIREESCIGNKKQNDIFMDNIRKTIKEYEALLSKQTSQNKDTTYIHNLLDSLNSELNLYMKKKEIKNEKLSIPINSPSINEALEEIFIFYSRQRFKNSRVSTFEELGNEQKEIPLGDFIKMLKDFHVPIELKVILSLILRK